MDTKTPKNLNLNYEKHFFMENNDSKKKIDQLPEPIYLDGDFFKKSKNVGTDVWNRLSWKKNIKISQKHH